jgi:hypothetical protein
MISSLFLNTCIDDVPLTNQDHIIAFEQNLLHSHAYSVSAPMTTAYQPQIMPAAYRVMTTSYAQVTEESLEKNTKTTLILCIQPEPRT